MEHKKNEIYRSIWRQVKAIATGIFLSAVLTVTMAGCTTTSGTETDDGTATVDGVAATSLNVQYSTEDMDASWDAAKATTITLSDSESTVDGSGANVISGTNAIQITKAGTYVVSGNLPDGQIIVEAGGDDLVRIVLDNASITYKDGAAISVVECDKTIITLAESSSNSVSGGIEDAADSSSIVEDAAIYSEKDLTINGSGGLKVEGTLGNGIETKDDLVITGGSITVNAANDALRGRDSIAINSGTFILTAGGDGLQANNDVDKDQGWISIDGGIFKINVSDAGLKAESLLQVTAGKLTIDSDYDSLHSNTNMNVTGGTISVSAGDDALHSDTLLNISGGTIKISTCYEGLESTEINVSGGKINILAEDDGLNAAGGNDGSSQASGAPQQDNFAADESCIINISGGVLNVNSGGDGLDSNGSITISDGTVNVSGPTSDRDAPMDYNGTCIVTGGTLAIAGSAGMAQSPSDTSSQDSITVFFNGTMSAGTKITVVDASGNKVLSYTPEKAFASIVLSSPDLAEGETYTIYSGSTKLTSVTLDSTVNAISSDGSAVQSNSGQPGQPGLQPDGNSGATPQN
jgi:hypothetical protein